MNIVENCLIQRDYVIAAYDALTRIFRDDVTIIDVIVCNHASRTCRAILDVDDVAIRIVMQSRDE